jgi:hypothetical protein
MNTNTIGSERGRRHTSFDALLAWTMDRPIQPHRRITASLAAPQTTLFIHIQKRRENVRDTLCLLLLLLT